MQVTIRALMVGVMAPMQVLLLRRMGLAVVVIPLKRTAATSSRLPMALPVVPLADRPHRRVYQCTGPI